MEQKKDRSVLIISAVIVAAFVIFGAVAPEALNEVANVLFTVFTVDFCWLYLLVVFVMVIYAVAGLALGYFAFRLDRPFLVSSAFEPLLGEKVHGPIGKAMQIVADVKVYLSVAFMVFIFVFGGAVFICNIFVTDLGGYLQNFIHKSLWMENGEFVQGWTVFYWAWWIAWAPFCGQFVARVSRGRTIREYLFAVMLLPAGFCVIWLAIYGGAAFNINELTGGGFVTALGADNGTTIALFAFLNELPFKDGLFGGRPSLSGEMKTQDGGGLDATSSSAHGPWLPRPQRSR